MKNTTSLLSKIAVLSGLALGAFALSAFAYSPWKGPDCGPHDCNADKPIQQYGQAWQDASTGTLLLGALVFNPGGAQSISDGQVLMSSGGNGTVKWGSASGGTLTKTVTSYNAPLGSFTHHCSAPGAFGGCNGYDYWYFAIPGTHDFCTVSGALINFGSGDADQYYMYGTQGGSWQLRTSITDWQNKYSVKCFDITL